MKKTLLLTVLATLCLASTAQAQNPSEIYDGNAIQADAPSSATHAGCHNIFYTGFAYAYLVVGSTRIDCSGNNRIQSVKCETWIEKQGSGTGWYTVNTGVNQCVTQSSADYSSNYGYGGGYYRTFHRFTKIPKPGYWYRLVIDWPGTCQAAGPYGRGLECTYTWAPWRYYNYGPR